MILRGFYGGLFDYVVKYVGKQGRFGTPVCKPTPISFLGHLEPFEMLTFRVLSFTE